MFIKTVTFLEPAVNKKTRMHENKNRDGRILSMFYLQQPEQDVQYYNEKAGSGAGPQLLLKSLNQHLFVCV